MADLNRLYRRETALHEVDFDYRGFEWIDCHNYEDSTLSYIRRGQGSERLTWSSAATSRRSSRQSYRLGVPEAVLVRGDLQQRLDVLRRQQRGQRPGRDGRADSLERPPLLDWADACAAGHVDAEAPADSRTRARRLVRSAASSAANGAAL